MITVLQDGLIWLFKNLLQGLFHLQYYKTLTWYYTSLVTDAVIMHAFCHKLRNYSYVLTLIWVNMQYQYLNSQANFPCCYKTASQVKIIYSHVFTLYSRIHNLQLYNISESLLTTICLDIGFMYMYFLGTTL